jgi:hypothetical protein
MYLIVTNINRVSDGVEWNLSKYSLNQNISVGYLGLNEPSFIINLGKWATWKDNK